MFESEPTRILVVDDEPVIRELLAEFLTMEGFAVRTAENGEDALVELSRGPFDLILSDLKMPKMGGIELLQALTKHNPGIVVILMTGFGTVETAIDAMKRGAYDYILKPFKVEEVIHTIRRGIEQRKLASENLRLREALSLYKVSEAIAASLSLDEVLSTVTRAALDEIEADQVVVMLADGAGGFFERANETNADFRPVAELAALNTTTLFEHFQRDQSLREHGPKTYPFVEISAEGMRPHSLAVAPLFIRKEVRGFLAVLSYTRGKKFEEAQRKLLKIVADRAAVAIENANLYEDLKATFHQTIQGLASAIDKMDRYTRGHSERVAAYAQLIAVKLGLGEDMIELVRQGALLHDIGKIGCVMNLNKPGKLSQDEYDVFKRHPEFGEDILQPIAFLHPLVPAVHLHHERWDGHGYPLGLKAHEIPLLARIISVADTYDAMTSDRAYRKALPHEVATAEICRCAGSQFDPDIAHPFREAIEDKRTADREAGRPVSE